MTVFWLLAASMTLVALLFVIPPLFRASRQLQLVDRDQLNTAVIKDQLAELKADLEAGKLEQDAYTAARHDLERELLDDLDANSLEQDSVTQSGRWIAGSLVVLVPAVSFFIYQQLGNTEILPRLAAGTQAPSSASAEQQRRSMEAMVEKLAARLSEKPDNLEGWIMLGRSYSIMKRFQEAANAYAQAYRLGGDQPELLTDYADVLIMASGGVFTDEAGELLKKALDIQPQNLKALWLMGHWKLQRDDYAGAISDWQRVVALLPPGSENLAQIEQQIEQARMVAAQQGVAVPVQQAEASPAQPVSSGGRIQVRVELDPKLRQKAADEDTVFIFARAVSGPKMPLAIVRKQVKNLPVTVTLDDSQAMTPAMVLSNFPEVTVGARISKTGQALPASGDLQGTLSPVSTGSGADVELTIDQVVP
jgi:cytochrome c-type biogenesis protein CcmH